MNRYAQRKLKTRQNKRGTAPETDPANYEISSHFMELLRSRASLSCIIDEGFDLDDYRFFSFPFYNWSAWLHHCLNAPVSGN